MSRLRPIAISVEESRAQRFVWVLLERESEGDAWHTLAQADSAVASYQEAMADGLLALQALVEDLALGPRLEEAGDAKQKPARSAKRKTERRHERKDDDEADTSAKAPARKSYFGFGPVG